MEKESLASALCKAQGMMGPAYKNKTQPHFKSSYADLGSVITAIREPLADNGLSVTQTFENDGTLTLLITTLWHVGGESVRSSIPLPSLTDPQKLGSAITYFRRYSLMALVNLPAVDDDGQRASNAPPPDDVPITQGQLDALTALVGEREDIGTELLQVCGGDLSAMKASRYAAAWKWLQKRLKKEPTYDAI